ncbi:hypothetical protein ATERTT37_006044 [Aspergillus terreus]
MNGASSHKRRQSYAMDDGAYIPRATQPARTRSVSYRHAQPAPPDQDPSRSFAARAKDLPSNADLYGMDKPFSPEPPATPDGYGAFETVNQKQAPQLSSPVNSLPSRSNTVRSTSDQRHDWASDRSPLQKLEVTLNGISKEEKRARVLEAEMKLKERMAREKREGSTTNQSPQRARSERPTNPPVIVDAPSSIDSRRPSAQENATTTRSHAPSMKYGVLGPSSDNHANMPAMKMGHVPRRSVSTNHRAANGLDAPWANERMKRVRIDGPNGPFDKETWRGSVLIVTKDSRSTYEPSPSLRLFSQPMDLLPPPPAELSGEDAQLAPEYVDPTAGLMKLGRDGRPLYVKPVEHTEEELDLSFIENDDGVYEMSPSIMDYSSGGIKQPIPANRVHSVDGEATGVYKEIAGARLYADPGRDVTFWRFNIEVELGPTQQRVAYRINQGPALGFWVPARGQSMNIMFHTCNGFSQGVDTNKFCGPDPLWRDILNEHQTRPFHVMLGGGDQIFNDRVTAESKHFQDWIRIKNLHERYDAPLSAEFKAELETGFLEHYSAWFSQGLFSLANSQIPMVNMWNDHEILEGFGSYPDEFMGTPVISGLGGIAFKYYLLFQHHSVPEETESDEPTWLLGAQPGPYINQRSRNLFMSLGDGVVLLGLDCRTERMSDEVLSEQTCDLIWDRCHREIVRGETKHLIVLLSIPIAYPRVPRQAMVKNILNSRKSLGKAGLFGGLVNKSGGKVEIYDDHWTAKHHKAERTYLIEDLQDLAADKSVRVTILSGDVHLAAIGEFYSNPKLNVPKDKDYRYMPNVISSAIVDMPETEMISDTLNRRNRVHHVDTNTDEDMIPIFTHDVNNKPRNNKRLLPRRNWCSIREYRPGSTPPGTPETESPPAPVDEPRPGKLQRTLSLTRGDRPQTSSGGLLRRFSLRGAPPTKEFNLGGTTAPQRRMSTDGAFPPTESGDSYFPRPSTSAEFRPGPFHRRPTILGQKASKKTRKRGDNGVGDFVDLEGGLAITLNLELNPKDPAGITTPYKLLVPMLRYEGTEYDPPANPVAKGWKKWLGMRRGPKQRSAREEVEDTEVEDEEMSEEEEVSR